MRTTALTAATLLLGVGVLAGCSSSSDETTTTEASPEATAEASMVGGMATCDEATFTQVVTDQIAAEGSETQLFSLDGFECVDGWAAVFPTVGTTEEDAVTETLVYEAEGQFWIPKDRMAVCGTVNMDDPSAYPADSQVPEALWPSACNTN